MATTLDQLISLSREAWRERAACKDVDTNIFFIGPGKSPDTALAVCNRCEVKDECLQFALDNEEDFGIWGGLCADQRKKLRQARTAAPPLTRSESAARDNANSSVRSSLAGASGRRSLPGSNCIPQSAPSHSHVVTVGTG
ncbi:WhiB family transcriptional regulator [Candidatus Poriferisodalis sp.]|uniref:WhiB family transcriptional regulator n=1 Tax=Candidatus Poriferisodalis sp. TaxID=3101277 RepID=UPI003B011AC6